MDLELSDRLRLNKVEGFPAHLLESPPHDLWRHLPGPTLFHIEGHQTSPLFVSILLHGNESTGWSAVRATLARYGTRGLPRSLLLFVGNIEAAKKNVRTLPDQIDYNRCWPGTLHGDTPEARLMKEVVACTTALKPFASIDIHNNTGWNPHYACINRLDERYLHLARLFSRTVVYFERPLGVQSAALAPICPAVTVECGLAGGAEGIAHAVQFLEAALSLDHFPEHPVPDGDVDLMQTHAIIKVPEAATVSFDGGDADFRFRPDLDRLNFSELEPGTTFGRLGNAASPRLVVEPGAPHIPPSGYFSYEDGEIRLTRSAIPAMLTKDERAIRLDCLGYLMHRISREGFARE
jgi:hypothetical protein